MTKKSSSKKTTSEEKENTEVKKIKTKEVSTVSHKIHLSKYLITNTFSKGIIELLKTKFGLEMHSEKEWKKLIEIELTRRVS